MTNLMRRVLTVRESDSQAQNAPALWFPSRIEQSRRDLLQQLLAAHATPASTLGQSLREVREEG